MQLENLGVLLESLYKHIDLWMIYWYIVPGNMDAVPDCNRFCVGGTGNAWKPALSEE